VTDPMQEILDTLAGRYDWLDGIIDAIVAGTQTTSEGTALGALALQIEETSQRDPAMPKVLALVAVQRLAKLRLITEGGPLRKVRF